MVDKLNTRVSNRSEKLPRRHVLTFASSSFGAGILHDPMPTILISFYALYTPVSMGMIGTILLFSRLIDAITDPLTGYLSDKTQSPLGRRKPWLIGGIAFGMVSVYYFFNPPSDASPLYFFLAYNLYFLARTLITIPVFSWGSEITRNYQERTRLGTYSGILLLISQLFFMSLPVIVSSPLLPIYDSAEFGPEMISFIGWVGIVFLPLFLGIAIIGAPSGKHVSVKSDSISDMFKGLKGNKPFWFFLIAKGIGQIGYLMFFGLVIIYMDSYMGFGNKVPLILVVLTATQIGVIPLWRLIAKRFGKHRTWGISWAIHGLLLPMVFFIEPGPEYFTLFLIFAIIVAITQAPAIMLSSAIMSDIIDYDILKTGVNRAGNYFSLESFILKGVSALAGSVGFWLLAAFAYDPKGLENSSQAEFGLLFTMTVIPMVLLVISGALLWFFPINEKRQSIIKKRIETRASRVNI